MRRMQTSSPSRIVATHADAVKGRIVSAGVRLTDLARAAGLAKSTLSESVHGGHTARDGREAIWLAFRRLTGMEISYLDFWAGPSRREDAA